MRCYLVARRCPRQGSCCLQAGIRNPPTNLVTVVSLCLVSMSLMSGRHLVRPSSRPPPPTSKVRRVPRWPSFMKLGPLWEMMIKPGRPTPGATRVAQC